MKTILLPVSLAVVLGCGGSSAPPDRLANFVGAPWNASLTTTVNCAFVSQSGTRTFSIPFQRGSGTDLQFNSAEGCLYKFNVSGNTATLSNGPVSCTVSVNGVAVAATWTTYTATTGDGHNMTVSTAGSGSALGQTCPFSETGSATR
jgi:hypothetical protein